MYMTIGVIVLFLIGHSASMITKQKEKAVYNKGQCMCGGEFIPYELQTKHEIGWICDNCGTTVRTTWIKLARGEEDDE
ncbi:hypothetical protein ACQKJG_18375 [Priestia megaterium]|uniref:hypothetical protein n=1 Tax=Priestia megaterium TaxID=1404 RepID=UPI003D08821E